MAAASIVQFEFRQLAKRLFASVALGCAFAMLGSGCVYFSKHTVEGACSNDLGSPIRNFCVVTPGVLWRGERPSKKDASWLLQHGVGTVVNLEVVLDDHIAFEDAAVSSDLTRTVDYFQIRDFEPVHALNWSLLDDHVARFLAVVSNSPKPVYVHCLDGIDRTSVLIAAYRMLIEGYSREKALEEMERFHSPWHRVDAKYINSLQGARRAELLHKLEQYKSKLHAPAQIVCASGKCTYKEQSPLA